MLYFIKRNHKLKEYNTYFWKVHALCIYLDKLSPELRIAKSLIWQENKATELGRFLEEKVVKGNISLADFSRDYSLYRKMGDEQEQKELEKLTITFNAMEFNGLDLGGKDSFVVLRNFVRSFKVLLEELKTYESFQGRIKFGQFSELFNFEDYIYEDKQFQYSIISNYNKRLIPEFISSVFTELVYENHVSEEIRRNMEQYFLAIMSNMDYQNYAHISQLKNELKVVLDDEGKNIFYVLGAAPQIFNDKEYVDLLNERIERVNFLFENGIKTKGQTNIWMREIGNKHRDINSCSCIFIKNPGTLAKSVNGGRPITKLTSENLEFIFKDIVNRDLTGYNLFLLTSTFHILKAAIEVERYFYNVESNKPNNIIFIGDEKFFDLAHNIENCQNEKEKNYHKKKLKSFLYELFLHSLDRNAIKS